MTDEEKLNYIAKTLSRVSALLVVNAGLYTDSSEENYAIVPENSYNEVLVRLDEMHSIIREGTHG